MRSKTLPILIFAGVLLGSCSAGSGETAEGLFRLIEFLENGQAEIPRNRAMTFRFSAPVAAIQDFAERLKIENIQTGQNPNFSRAIGRYLVSGDRVSFDPRLPELPDRSDAGFRSGGNYVVFLKAGVDALRSEGGKTIDTPQELGFNTNEFFEDPTPTDPPRALKLEAVDVVFTTTVDISRVDPRPSELALADSNDLITAGRVIDPGAGGLGAGFSTPWRFDLSISEPIDPASVTTKTIQMFEIFSDATETDEDSAPGAAAGHFGDAVSFKVPINVEVVQGLNSQGVLEFRIRVIPLFTLVDDTRYRIVFSGNILGLDYRRTFIGDNGLTGDGATLLAGAGLPFAEPGGLGYVSEFVVRDRPSISGRRTLSYDPLTDGIRPELGQTEADEDEFNSALYNPLSNPGTAVGFLSAFGNGLDGDLAVATGSQTQIDTGDTPNIDKGTPFTVNDLNPNNDFKGNPLPGGPITFDSPEPFELSLETLTVAGTLRIIGRNPIVLRVRGIAQVSGTIDIAGGDGFTAGGGAALAGAAGAGGFPGGASRRPPGTCTYRPGSCSNHTVYLTNCGVRNNNFPDSDPGEGPGRGMPGGETYIYPSGGTAGGIEASGGGGGSHATAGTPGEDRRNASQAAGTGGICMNGFVRVRLSGVIGVRGRPGPTYGDREVDDVILGGSGGGAGGSAATYSNFTPGPGAGGSGGGGGGTLFIVSAGAIVMSGGIIDASGGDGGRGTFSNWNNSTSNRVTRGAGGAGSGGNIVLISGDDLILTGATLDAAGGTGGVRADAGTAVTCAGCNAGGDGGQGYIFLMDADGALTGFLPGLPGEYDSFVGGVLTISSFNADRFSSIAAITELFNVLAADPDYLPLAPGDVIANVNPDQSISILASSAKGDPDEPLNPDVSTEIAAFEIALVVFDSGATVVMPKNDMNDLNPAAQAPQRDSFVRVRANFVYTRGVESALGPFASIDRVDVTFTFN